MVSRLAVLGANGFIGTRIVEMLHLAKWTEVRPVVRRLSALATASRFDINGAVADAFDEGALAEAFRDCSAVVHCVAGDPGTILGSVDPVYHAAERAGVKRIVYLSSASVHGQAPIPGTNEDTPLSAKQGLPYNNAKVRAEWRLQELRRKGTVEVVILRPSIVFGPRSQWTGGFADELLAGRAYLVEGGRGICNSIYVDNLVHAVQLALSAEHVDGEAFLVGDAETVTWAELCEPIATALGYDVQHLTANRPGHARFSLQKTLNDLRRGRIVQGALARMPAKWSAAMRAGFSAYRAARNADHPFDHHSYPEVTSERVDLHTCPYRLPSVKASTILGFNPPVTFNCGIERSIDWLYFAGYPVVEAAHTRDIRRLPRTS